MGPALGSREPEGVVERVDECPEDPGHERGVGWIVGALPLVELGVPDEHLARGGRVDAVDRGGDGGDPLELADDGAVFGPPVAAERLAHERERPRRRGQRRAGRDAPVESTPGEWGGKRRGGAIRPFAAWPARAGSAGAGTAAPAGQLPLAPEIGQGGDDVHRTEGSRGGAPRGEIRGSAQGLCAERRRDLGRELVRETRCRPGR